MTLVRLNDCGQLIPWRRFTGLGRELEQILGGVGRDGARAVADWRPAADLVEAEDGYHIELDVPGLTEKDVQIQFEDDVLTVSGERKTEHKSVEDGYRYVERRQGRFERSFRLPQGIDAEQVKANIEQGVLRVTLPKPEKLKPKQIPVNFN